MFGRVLVRDNVDNPSQAKSCFKINSSGDSQCVSKNETPLVSNAVTPSQKVHANSNVQQQSFSNQGITKEPIAPEKTQFHGDSTSNSSTQKSTGLKNNFSPENSTSKYIHFIILVQEKIQKIKLKPICRV